MMIDGNENTALGNIQSGIGTITPRSTLDIRGNTGHLSVASASGTTTAAAFIVDNSGTGDLLTASKGALQPLLSKTMEPSLTVTTKQPADYSTALQPAHLLSPQPGLPDKFCNSMAQQLPSWIHRFCNELLGSYQ